MISNERVLSKNMGSIKKNVNGEYNTQQRHIVIKQEQKGVI